MKKITKTIFMLGMLIATESFCSSPPQSNVEMVSFDISDMKLIDLINSICAKRSINIILPEKQDGLDVKINFPYKKAVTPARAWEFLVTILQMSGFIVSPQGDDYQIRSNKDILATALPFWGGSFPPEALPNSDESIRYIYSFVNIDIGNSAGAKANLQTIFKDMLPGDGKQALFDIKSNSVILTGSAANIKGVMHIVKELDITGFRESIEVLPLRNAQASDVVQIINELIPDAKETRVYPLPQERTKRTSYFSKNTRVVPIPSSNAVAIMGKIESVNRVSDFIHKYLDTPAEGGKNILHIKRLNNLNAEEFAVELNSLVKNKLAASQSTGKSAKDNVLSGVIIVAQKISEIKSEKGKLKETDLAKQFGAGAADLSQENLSGANAGNNLIIAAKESDWKMIEYIVDQLDRPQLQVAFEVLIAEIKLSDQKLLEAQLRGSEDVCNPPPTAKWQSSQITQPVLNYITDSAGKKVVDSSQGLDANLMNPDPQAADPKIINIAQLAAAGTTILSYKSTNGILGILDMLSKYDRSSILAQPFVVTSNHQQASIELVNQKLAPGSADTASTGGPVTLNSRALNAALSVALFPHISISNNVNLQILVTANNFVAGSQTTRSIRQVTTNANVQDKEVLVLGGLTKIGTSDSITGTPVLSQIPLIGNLFKKNSQGYARSILLIFIAPTIIRPLLSGGIDKFTQAKSKVLKDEILTAGENFEAMNDPITRMVFPYSHNESKNFDESIDVYLKQGSYTNTFKSAYSKKIQSENLKKIVDEQRGLYEVEQKVDIQSQRKEIKKDIEKHSAKNSKESKPNKKEQALKKKLKNKKNPLKNKKPKKKRP